MPSALRDELLARRADSAMVQAADVSDPTAVEAMMQGIRREWGGLDILVNNAGILRDRSIAKMTLEEWRSVIDVDLSGVFYCCKFGLEVLRDGGSIVSVGSLAAKMGFHGQSNYAAAKAGVQALTRVLARECARRSIRVNAVAPGVIDTPMAAQITDPRGPNWSSRSPCSGWDSPRTWPRRSSSSARRWPATSRDMCSRSTAAFWDDPAQPGRLRPRVAS